MSIIPRMARVLGLGAVLTIGGAAAATGVLQQAAAAPPPPPLTQLFTDGGGGTAAWVSGTDADGDGRFVHLTAPTPANFAGIDLGPVPTAPPATPPSFWYRSATTNTNPGGAPRLVISFSDGGDLNLRPLSVTANAWTHELGTSNDWDDDGHATGNTCPFQFEKSYASLVACHLANHATVTDVFVVIDQFGNWGSAGPVIDIDDITYGNLVVTVPPQDVPGSTSCGTTITHNVIGNVNVTSGTTCLENVTVSGNVTVGSGAAVVSQGSKIAGGVTTTGAQSVTLCGTTVAGQVTIRNSTGFVLLGDGGDGSFGCPADRLGGAVQLTGNHGGLELGGDGVTGVVILSQNTAPGGGEDSSIEVEGNSLGSSLQCTANTPAPVDDGSANTVRGVRTGQCSSASF